MQEREKSLKSKISKLLLDNTSGSSAITAQAISIIQEYISKAENYKSVRRNILQTHRQLKQQFPEFAVLDHFLKFSENTLQNAEDINIYAQEIQEYRQHYENVERKIVTKALQHLNFKNKIILTHSHSSTVVALFREMNKQNIPASVIQTESGPAFEGKIQAKTLAAIGFKVKLITDAAAAKAITMADLILTGADAADKEHFINKTGTLALALASHYFNVPFYVLLDSRKITNEVSTPASKPPEEEVWQEPHQNIEVVNEYFELVPNRLITGFITEKY